MSAAHLSTSTPVDGFIANTANYSALSEPWVTIGVNGTSKRQSPWVLDVSAS